MGIPRHVRGVRRPTKRLDIDVAFARRVHTLPCASDLITAVPNWTVGETFLLGHGERFRVLEIRTDLLPEMLEAAKPTQPGVPGAPNAARTRAHAEPN